MGRSQVARNRAQGRGGGRGRGRGRDNSGCVSSGVISHGRKKHQQPPPQQQPHEPVDVTADSDGEAEDGYYGYYDNHDDGYHHHSAMRVIPDGDVFTDSPQSLSHGGSDRGPMDSIDVSRLSICLAGLDSSDWLRISPRMATIFNEKYRGGPGKSTANISDSRDDEVNGKRNVGCLLSSPPSPPRQGLEYLVENQNGKEDNEDIGENEDASKHEEEEEEELDSWLDDMIS